MDKSISTLVKSKSSNRALTQLKAKDNKSRSIVAMQTMKVKKRGVYVESKLSKESLNSPDDISTTFHKENASPKLSTDPNHDVTTGNIKMKKKKTINQLNVTRNKDGAKSKRNNEKKSSFKYKSKVLKNQVADEVKLEILKPRKNLMNSPSIYSVSSKMEEDKFDNIHWSDFLPRLVNTDGDEAQFEKERKLNHLVREVTEGRMVKNVKVRPIVEPPTLVSELKTDKGLFNFCVDLLETTFSVYNVNTKYDASPNINSVSSSKIALEIDESVANRLNVCINSPNEPSPSPSNHYRLENKEQCWYDDKKCNKSNGSPKYMQNRQESPSGSTVEKKQLKSKSVASTKRQNQASYSNRAVSPPRRITKNSSKKNSKKKLLLNLLKEQLMIDVCPLEEPRNIYEALKVMAKTKRKSHKTIRFDKFVKMDNGHECTLKRRKVISPLQSTENNSGNSRSTRTMSPRSFRLNRRYIQSSASNTSNHSLQVFNVDYGANGRKRKKLSPSESENNFRQYDVMMKHVLNTVEAIRKAKSYVSTTNSLCSSNM